LTASTPKSPVARRLRELRELRGISQRQLGILAGIDPSSASPRMNQYEQDKHVPDYQMASRLAKVLGVPTAYLYTEEDDLAAKILFYTRAE
jgi:transcriptional regulator with XRE-family HTH domain